MDGEPTGEKIVAFKDTSMFVGADGECTVQGVALYSDGVSPEGAAEVLAERKGIDPDKIAFRTSPDEPFRHRDGRRSRKSVGFSRWNSSWDPHAERPESPTDPSLN